MIRKIIKIDAEKCNGCALCVNACHEGAIAIVDGKAKLVRDDYCDGLGNCLPVCPTGAIGFEERINNCETQQNCNSEDCAMANNCQASVQNTSELRQWPVQIKLVPANAPYLKNADLLIAADCTAFAFGDFHKHFMKGKISLIGCPKLDNVDYSYKLAEIFRNSNILSVTIIRMEVPCCSGLESAVVSAMKKAGKMPPWQSIILTIDGGIAG